MTDKEFKDWIDKKHREWATALAMQLLPEEATKKAEIMAQVPTLGKRPFMAGAEMVRELWLKMEAEKNDKPTN